VADLLTTKELQDLLKIDRTTIYRMLKDGRITGVRVGNQWRFLREEIESTLAVSTSVGKVSVPLPADALPLHCVRPIQQVFAEIARVGSLTTSPEGEPLTEISNSCEFCSLILQSESGRQGCVSSWKKLAHQSDKQPQFATCHAGLQYARARIEVDGKLAAMVIAGQFYAQPTDPSEERRRIAGLAANYEIDPDALASAAEKIRVLDKRHEEQIGGWLQKVADTFEQVAHERASLMNRLQRIADMSTLPRAE
jgi:excisionase family DNA binding protein